MNTPLPHGLNPLMKSDDWKKSQTFIPKIEEEAFIPVNTQDLWIIEEEYKEENPNQIS